MYLGNFMKPFKIIFIIVGAFASLAFILFIISLFLNSKFSINREIVIKAQPEDIYNYFDDLKLWDSLTVWTKLQDSTLNNIYGSQTSGEGAGMRWYSKKIGDGDLKITSSHPVRELEYEMGLDKGSFKMKGKVSFVIIKDGTRVTWLNAGDVGFNPMARLFLAFANVESMMAPDYEKGLANLKKLVENKLEEQMKKIEANKMKNN